MLLFISMESTSQCEGVLYHTTSFHSLLGLFNAFNGKIHVLQCNKLFIKIFISEPINIAIDKMK